MTARSGLGPLVGAHMSAAGGLPKAVERAKAAGCRTLQVFTKSSSQWEGKPVVPAEAAAFRQAAEDASLSPLVSHSAYLINLAAKDPIVAARSRAALVDEVRRCDALGIAFLVLHPGSHGGDGEAAGIDRIARALDAALEEAAGSKAKVLLETSAGQGASVGHTFEQLASVLSAASSRRRLALCLDTCHGTGSGGPSTRSTPPAASASSRSSTPTTRRGRGAAASTGTSGSAAAPSARRPSRT